MGGLELDVDTVRAGEEIWYDLRKENYEEMTDTTYSEYNTELDVISTTSSKHVLPKLLIKLTKTQKRD